ncbi:MAG TPA: hypothetical protein VKQ36_17610 [Ktedonobacterales bacterium]|nr:hypothetical protein [Ktedonobacterales bacterium]
MAGTWYRVSVALSKRRWGVVIAFVILGLALAYVGYDAQVQADMRATALVAV